MSALSRSSLNYREVTVFAPVNAAFDKFRGDLGQNLTCYHVAYNAYRLRDLNDTYLEPIQKGLPPLWIRNYNGDIYVNNALILPIRSDYQSNHRQDILGKPQVLHVIDEVLDPVLMNGDNPQTAYEFLRTTKDYGVKKFLRKIQQFKLEDLFDSDGVNTYFIPGDEGMDDYKMKMTDSYIIKAHVIPKRVLFTRPVPKNSIYDTLADVDYIYILLSFLKEHQKYYIKSNTILGDATHQNGEIKSEIIHQNIPVKNGVIHIIKRPLGVFDKVLTKFPYLPILDKLANDPYLNTTYVLGQKSGFNNLLKQPKKFTFFVPKDQGWTSVKNLYDYDRLLRMGYMNEIKKILGRHLIIGDIPYSMETLFNASSSNCVFLKTSSGRSCFSILYKNSDKKFVIKWNNVYIDVYKSNYECSNGLIHVIDRPLVTNSDFENVPEESGSFLQLWNALHKILTS
ncbi:periostin-related [Holotrichia oblita]|uniref:Periostin-related n=1 Tax=Holotrichia oblita TaxID=644536 RepID=A0ACB9SJ96_HOLOL|nr:periostin-related [Holotrichia oblita]